jgi:hypothetical protein
MSQEIDTSVEDQKSEGQIDVEALMKRVKELEASKERVENESKKYKSNFYALRDEVEKKEKAKLEESENWKELLEIEKNKAFKYEEDMKNLKKKALSEKLNAEIAMHAKDAKKFDYVRKLIPTDMIQIDEENLSIAGVDQAVGHLRKEFPELFQSNKQSMMSGRPNVDVARSDYESLSKEDQELLFKQELLKTLE